MQNPEHLRPIHPEQTVILLAEDDVLVQNVVRIVLESVGYFILTAENGEDALHISRKYPGPIHLLLSDVKMPKLSGVELKKQFQRERPATTVLLMSGETMEQVDGPLLRKPFTPEVLRRKVREHIESPVLIPPAMDLQ
jgi:two-component system cell cycle sensor histidine kinase/response regulator CckA